MNNNSIVQYGILDENIETTEFLKEQLNKTYQVAMDSPEVQNAMQGGFTGPEILSIITLKQLEVCSDYGYIESVLRHKLIQKIESTVDGPDGPRGLWEFHPNRHGGSCEDLIESEGKLSKSVQSTTKDLHNIIIPYVRDVLGMDEITFWRRAAKKSNLAEAMPFLKVLATGIPSSSSKVNDGVQKKLQEANGSSEKAFMNLVEDIENMTSSQMGDNLGHSPKRDAMILQRNGHSFLLAEFDTDERDEVAKSLKAKWNLAFFNIQKEDPSRILEVKHLLGKA